MKDWWSTTPAGQGETLGTNSNAGGAHLSLRRLLTESLLAARRTVLLPFHRVKNLVEAQQLDMPDLSALCWRNTSTHAFRNWLTGHGLQGVPERALLTRLVALSDRASREYEDARECLEQFIARPKNGPPYTLLVFEASDHLEASISALHRAALHAEVLKRLPSVPKITRPELLSNGEIAEIRFLRDATEHLERDLLAGKVAIGANVLIAPGADGFEFGGKEVRYARLAQWITKLIRLAERLVEHDPHERDRSLSPV